MFKPFSLSVRAVIFDERRRCLFLRRSARSRHFAGCWEWPGGKVEPGEDFAAALLREVREETSMEIEITGLAASGEFELPEVRVVCLCMEARPTTNPIGLKLSPEHEESAWVAMSEFSRYELSRDMAGVMRAYAKKKGSE